MSQEKLSRLLQQLQATQQEISALLGSLAAQQDWQPAPRQWSLRQIAAHLATSESACLLPRLQQIAGGSNPHFGIYLDTETEFDRRTLPDALADWALARNQVIDFVNGLSAEQLAYNSYHPTFGRLTVLGYLQVFLDHDLRHLAELQEMIIRLPAATAEENKP